MGNVGEYVIHGTLWDIVTDCFNKYHHATYSYHQISSLRGLRNIALIPLPRDYFIKGDTLDTWRIIPGLVSG